MVNEKTFMGEMMGRRKNNFVNRLILEYQFFYLKRSQKTE